MLTNWLVRRFVADPESVTDPRVRARFGLLEGMVSVAVNSFLALVKGVLGLFSGSVALLADAFHSLSDVASSAVVIWGFKAAARPADRKHPFGHGRLESVAALVIAILLLVAAAEFAKASVQRMLSPRPMAVSHWILLALGLTLVLKEWLAGFARRLGRHLDSPALVADSWHHRSDVLSTLAVIAALVMGRFGWYWADGAAGLIVSMVLVWAGVLMVKDAVHPLIGEAPSAAVLNRIRHTALGFRGVDKVHDIIVHQYGSFLVTSLHIEVSAELDAVAAHELAEDVENAVAAQMGGWVTVHVDPVDRDHPLYPDLEAFLEEQVQRTPGTAGFCDLRIVGRRNPCFVLFELAAEDDSSRQSAARLRAALLERFPEVRKVDINVRSRLSS